MFRAGISDPVNTVLAWYVARDAGFYAAQGLEVEIVNMNGGSRGAAELQAGRLDAMHVGLSSVIKVNRAGGDIRTIGSLALARLGLSRDDVTLKEYGGGMRRLAAVQSGEIAATPINEPIASLARGQGVNVLVDLVPAQIPWVFSSIVVRRRDIAQRQDVLLRFLKATIEGNYLALTDAARAKEVLAKELKIVDARIVEITYEDFKAQSPPNIEISLPGVENILALFPGVSRKITDYVDTTLLDGLRSDGFFAAMERKYRH